MDRGRKQSLRQAGIFAVRAPRLLPYIINLVGIKHFVKYVVVFGCVCETSDAASPSPTCNVVVETFSVPFVLCG